MDKTMEKVYDTINFHNVKYVRLETEDFNGIPRGLSLDVDYFMSRFKKGIPFPRILVMEVDGGIVPDSQISLYDNAILYPDPETFIALPWVDNVASVLCDFKAKDGTPLPYVPRNICKNQIARLEEIGYHMLSAYEYEFYVLNKDTLKPISDVKNIGSSLLQHKNSKHAYQIMDNLKKIGITPEKFHMECDPSAHELTMGPCVGIKGPDSAMRYKTTVKETCFQYDLTALFMSRPLSTMSGSSAHFNASLWDVNDEVNAFYDANKANNLSDIALNWIGGLQEHYQALTCLACPTYNCYERLALEFVPKNDTWGIDNRLTSFRIRSGDSHDTCIETRLSGAATNPYLMTAAVIIAGIDGIKRNLQPTRPIPITEKPSAENGKKVVKTLKESIEALKNDELFAEQFGSTFVSEFARMKEFEIKRANENKERLWDWYMEYYADII